jgi:hypothetical protein
MSTVVSAPPVASATFKPSFFFWMTLLMAFFVFGGFGMTYFFPLATGTFPPAPPVVHLHGFVYSTWMILLVVQAGLVNVRNVRLHRSIGMYCIAHAMAVILMGALITILGATGFRGGPAPHGITLGIFAVTGFALLFILAIRNTRNPNVHRRLILFAMLPILPPGIHRLYMVPFGITYFPLIPMYITLNLMAIAIIVQEWRASGAINKFTWIGAGWIVLQQVLHAMVGMSELAVDVTYWLGSLAHYR